MALPGNTEGGLGDSVCCKNTFFWLFPMMPRNQSMAATIRSGYARKRSSPNSLLGLTVYKKTHTRAPSVRSRLNVLSQLSWNLSGLENILLTSKRCVRSLV